MTVGSAEPAERKKRDERDSTIVPENTSSASWSSSSGLSPPPVSPSSLVPPVFSLIKAFTIDLRSSMCLISQSKRVCLVGLPAALYCSVCVISLKISSSTFFFWPWMKERRAWS